jgi:hypothetical protein
LRVLCGYDRRLCAEVLEAFVLELSRSLKRRAKKNLGLKTLRAAHTGAVIHLPASHQRDAVMLLQRANVAGYVFPASERWAPLVFSAGLRVGSSEGRDRIIAANEGILHYSYAEDHGVWVDVYDGPSRVACLKASFESEAAAFDRAEFVKMKLLTPADADAVEAWIAQAHRWESRSDAEEYIVAEKLRLPRFAWFSYDYELQTPDASGDRIAVDSDGTCQRV